MKSIFVIIMIVIIIIITPYIILDVSPNLCLSSSSSAVLLSILEITTKGLRIKSSLTTVENVDATKMIAAALYLPSSENQPDPPTSIFNKGKDKIQKTKTCRILLYNRYRLPSLFFKRGLILAPACSSKKRDCYSMDFGQISFHEETSWKSNTIWTNVSRQ